MIRASLSAMSYAKLARHFARLGHLRHATEILRWDEAVLMTQASGAARADALATLEGQMHGLLADPQVPAYLTRAGDEASVGRLGPWEAANLREIRRLQQRAAAVPATLVEQTTRAQLRAEQAWRTQREANDWEGFAPLLTEVVARKREQAAALSMALGISAYDALLDEYEPGCRVETIDRVFGHLRSVLPDLTEAAIERQRERPVTVPRGPFPIESQQRLARRLMLAVGFDERRGRLDVSHHPFCGGVPSDVRITTRYDETDFVSALMGVLHETGHAKYEQGLPEAHVAQPVGQARGMALHEGQSLLQEMQISRSRPFLEFAAPLIREAFPRAVATQPEAFTVENLYRVYTRVERSYIRVDADEVTYPSHIIVRYDIERALIEGRMEVEQIPEAWDAGMRELLQLPTGDDHARGCMQDVHWAAGLFGYFPTYTLGAVAASQLYASVVRRFRDLPERIAAGDFEGLNSYLRDHVWQKGSLLESDDLMRHATGRSLDAGFLEAHLRRRYLE
ncbi:MAG: carboxypeptidase M32 [Myxococcales bacterium]|nr:carboxypeptidase M32 [Myxococcales bacterium]